LEELLALLFEAVRIYPNHPDGRLVQTQLLSWTGQYNQVMRAAAAAIGNGEWPRAQANLERARQINPGSPTVVRLCEFVDEVRRQIETTRNRIDAALERGDQRQALILAHRLQKYVEQMSRPQRWPEAWRTMHANSSLLLTLYRLACRVCANVLGGARGTDRQ
jgi:hypothetical protein